MKIDHFRVLCLVHIADGYRRKGYVLNGCHRGAVSDYNRRALPFIEHIQCQVSGHRHHKNKYNAEIELNPCRQLGIPNVLESLQ